MLKYPLLIILLLCIAVYAPFSNKAFHMDSPVTVYMARQMTRNVADPQIGGYGKLLSFWNHTDLPGTSAFYVTPHPPLVPLYLTPFIAAFGENERALNWAMFPFFFASVAFFFGIACMLLPRWRFESTLVFLFSPVVFVNSQNVMLDVPLTAFCMASFYYLFRSGSARDAALAGLFATLACLTKFTGGTVVVSGLLFFMLSKKWKECSWFLFPFIILYGLWSAYNLTLWHTLQVLANGHAHYLLGDVRYRFERLFSFAGGTIVLPLFPISFALCVKKYRPVALVAAVAAVGWSCLLWARLGYSVSSASLYALSASSGAIVVYGAFVFTATDKNRARGISLFTHVFLQIVAGGFLTLYASRYLLPVVFVFVLFLAVLMDSLDLRIPKRHIWAVVIATCAVLSAGLSVSDYQFVNAERRVADDLRTRFPDAAAKVFYAGRLGYLYYADRAGFVNATASPAAPRSGDILVKNSLSHDDSHLFTDTTQLTALAPLRYPLFPLRAMTGRAGFYGNDRLPFAWITSPNYRIFYVYRKK
jgi:4-amino-4-deoxy-L-arabinose transferase-like glycosyltransferase